MRPVVVLTHLRLMTLHELGQFLHGCQRCKLSSLGRKQVVFGTGNPAASIMFVGEAPGFYEDQQGEPFVGAAGKLLNELLKSVGLSRADVYIANVIKCRPPNNRDPEPDEVETCKPFLFQQIGMIGPKLICTLGNWATQTLLERKVPITKVRGQAFRHNNLVIFPLLHPAAALHQGGLQEPLREDFRKLKAYLDQMIRPSEKPVHIPPAAPASRIFPPSQSPESQPATLQQSQMELFGS